MLAGDVDLKTWYKPEVDKKILKELSKRSDKKGIIDISIFFFAILDKSFAIKKLFKKLNVYKILVKKVL